jgi:hypothetical protein
VGASASHRRTLSSSSGGVHRCNHDTTSEPRGIGNLQRRGEARQSASTPAIVSSGSLSVQDEGEEEHAEGPGDRTHGDNARPQSVWSVLLHGSLLGRSHQARLVTHIGHCSAAMNRCLTHGEAALARVTLSRRVNSICKDPVREWISTLRVFPEE